MTATSAAQVTFEIADITSCELAPKSIDVVYSRDTILHIHDKAALFRRRAAYDSFMQLSGRCHIFVRQQSTCPAGLA
jgi:hypothetical protein